MDDAIPCCYCSGLIEEKGLTCCSCHRKLHFKCGTGLDNVRQRTITTYLHDCTFRCPLCRIGEKNALISTVITINQVFNERKHATEFRPDIILQETVLDDAQTVGPVTEAVDTANGTQHPGPSDGTLPNGGPPSQTSPLRLRDGPPPHGPGVDERDDFRVTVSRHEQRRIKRCKNMLTGLRNISTTVDTLLILDSNGKSIKGEDITNSGKIAVKCISGLCVGATVAALKECSVKYPLIKTLIYGLGTNDRLHAREHPGNKEDYLKALDTASKVVFPNAKLEFILPFSAINGLSVLFVDDLQKAINSSGVGWKIHRPPTMKGKLVSPNNIHLTDSGTKHYLNWLIKRFAPRRPAQTPADARSTSIPVSVPPSVFPKTAFKTMYTSGGNQPNVHIGDRAANVGEPRAFNHGILSQQAGESGHNKHYLDMLLKERLYELVLTPPDHTKHYFNRPSWPPWQ